MIRNLEKRMITLMASEENPSWADLPAVLLGIISGRLRNPLQIVRFRSVCRSWRSSTPLPPLNKLSAFFPATVPVFMPNVIIANAIYLVRPRSDPSKAWLVNVEEPVPRKLVLRHVLTDNEMNSDAGLDLEPDWIAATQTPIARFYASNIRRDGVNITRTLVCVFCDISQKTGRNRVVGLYTLGGLYTHGGKCVNLAIKLEAIKFSATDASILQCLEFNNRITHGILDCVRFNGRIFVVDERCHIYVLDHHAAHLMRVQAATPKPVRGEYDNWYRFVVSNGDLYLVWVFYKDPNDSVCEIYRLKVVETSKGGGGGGGTCCVRRILSKRVGDLGDTVFFITRACSFSISARLLPDPWQWEGNCVFISDFPNFDGHVVLFRRQTFTGLWTPPEGHSYSDLFSPPTSSDSIRPFMFMSSGLLKSMWRRLT